MVTFSFASTFCDPSTIALDETGSIHLFRVSKTPQCTSHTTYSSFSLFCLYKEEAHCPTFLLSRLKKQGGIHKAVYSGTKCISCTFCISDTVVSALLYSYWHDKIKVVFFMPQFQSVKFYYCKNYMGEIGSNVCIFTCYL